MHALKHVWLPILRQLSEFGVLGSYIGLPEGVGRGLDPKWAKMVQNTTTKGIIALFVFGQKWPLGSYSGWSDAKATPCMFGDPLTAISERVT